MIKKLVLVFIAIIAIQGYAQEGTASPYSFYGIGSLKFKGTVENRSMGGLSIYTDSIHVNLRNPASFGGKNLAVYNNEGRPMKFTVGGSHNSTKLTGNSGSDRVSSSTFDYLAISIPLGKLGVGIGLMPFTSVGYKLENYNNNDDLSTRFRGEGGVNKAYFALGYQITNGLSIGVDANYNFGNIKGNTIKFLYNDENELVQYQTRENNRSDLSGFNFGFGLLYKAKIKDNLELVSGFTYSPQSDLKSRNDRTFNTITISNITGQEFIINTIEADLASQNLKETNLVMPSKFSVGVGIGQPRKWFVGVENTFLQTSKFNNDLYSSVDTSYENSNTLSLGGFYIPNYNSFRGYWKRIVYRAGVRSEKTGLKINGESINEFGISFGVGLPIGNNLFSNANLGFEFGNRGTTNKNLIKENFINFQISLSLNDRWFQKRKFD